jgi:hypothetical protein
MRLFSKKMESLHVEQNYPGLDADEMDDNITTLTRQCRELRRIRNEFEIIMTKDIL